MTHDLAARRRGGKRPGAGAPKGNLNALKHGLRSQQVRSLSLALAQIPLFRRYLHRLACRRHQTTAATLALAAWLRHLHALHTPGPRGPLPPPPPLNYRAVRLLARHLAHQTIKQQGLAPIREAPKTRTSVRQSNAAPGVPPLALSSLPTPSPPPAPASPPPRRQSGASYRSHRG